jgi:AraC-like DNA-binding protein
MSDGHGHNGSGSAGGNGHGPVQRSRYSTDDLDEATAVLQATYVDYQPRFSLPRAGAGPARPALTMVGQSLATPLGSLALDRVQVGIGMSIHCEPFPRLTVAWPLTGRYEYSHGREVAGGMRLAPSWHGFDSWWDDRVEVVVHSLELSAVQRVGAALSGLEPEAVRFPSMHPVDPAAERYLVATLDHLDRTLLTNSEVLASPLVVAETMRELATMFLVVFPNTALGTVGDPEQAGPSRAEPATVRRALEFIDAHAHEPIGLGEIAEAARTGPRDLRAAFRRHLDTTPLARLRRVRLDRAHHDLMTADPDGLDTVAGIAARWGFPDVDRFSEAYRAAYGCSPSETFHR